MPEPGGIPYDAEKYRHEVIRADLANLCSAFCFEHGSKIAEEILRRYYVTPMNKKEKVA